MEFKKVQYIVFEEYVKNGFCSYWNDALNKTMADLAELGLITTEISEAMELVRDKDYSIDFEHELADIIIRTLNISTRLGIDIEEAILLKNRLNNNRPEKHGRKGI